MKKRFIPLSVPNLGKMEKAYVDECIETNWVSAAGKFVEEFEQAICSYSKVKYAVACVNATAGLFVCLKIAGVESGDEVIVPTLTFIAPVNAVRYLGAEPVFMDCDEYLNLDPVKFAIFCKDGCVLTSKGLKNKKTGRFIRAVLPVHVFGNPCQMQEIMGVARKYGLKVIEDAAESIGSYYTKGALKGKFTGTIGDAGVYSFNGNKIITTGSGGMIVTNDKYIADKARYLTTQAKDDPVRYIHSEVGYNLRLTNLQAALGIAQLKRLNEFIRIKKDNYALYRKLLEGIVGVRLLGVPAGASPNYWFYSLLVDESDYGMDINELMKRLQARGIQARPIWHLNHLQRPYQGNQAYMIENAPRFWRSILNLPCSTSLRTGQIRDITSVIRGLSEEKR